MIIDFINGNAGKGSLRFDEPQELTDAQKLQALENLGIDPDAGFKVYVVDELPTEDIDTKAIYLVPSDDQEEGNYYDEFMYVDGNWEKVGSTKIDLSDYYTKEEIDESYPIHIIPYIVGQQISEADYALIVKNPSKCMLKRINPDGSGSLTYPNLVDVYGTHASNGYEYYKFYSQDNHSYELTCLVQHNRTVSESKTDMLLAQPSDIKDSTITIKQGDVEQSFTLNQSDDKVIELQQGGGGNEWYGTQREWDALGEYSADTTYYITDITWTDIKNRPDMSRYATVAMLNDEVKTLDKKVVKKAELAYMTQDEFDAIEPLEGVTYCIEGETTTLTFELEDGTTHEYKVLN